MSLITTDQFTFVIGCGITGLSCARYLARKGARFALMDTREQLPHLDAVKQEFPDVDLYLGPLDADLLKRASEMVISPGVAKDQPAIQEAIASGVRLVGDIDLFCREVSAPIIAITGSNAKRRVKRMGIVLCWPGTVRYEAHRPYCRHLGSTHPLAALG
jgi:UDP-N-acetylmuramoylalanine--D-glutamate ligase